MRGSCANITQLSVAAITPRWLLAAAGDLYYPPAFVGVWDVESVLTSAEALGGGAASEAAVAQARRSEGQAVRYRARWLGTGAKGEAVLDRGFTSSSLMEVRSNLVSTCRRVRRASPF